MEIEVAALIRHAQQLFDGTPGSIEQQAANQWLMQFQHEQKAWRPVLQILETAISSPNSSPPAAIFVAMQILRLKIAQAWTGISLEEQEVVQKTLLTILNHVRSTSSGSTFSPAVIRIACVALGDVIVQSYSTWTSWKSMLQQFITTRDSENRDTGPTIFMDVLASIPGELVAKERAWSQEEMHHALENFCVECDTVLQGVHLLLTTSPCNSFNALYCLESWIVGCIPSHDQFGLDIRHLKRGNLIDKVIDAMLLDDDELVQLSSSILADAFEMTVTQHGIGDNETVEAVDTTTLRLSQLALNVVETPMSPAVVRGLSHVATTLGLYHSPAIITPHQRTDDSFLPHRFIDLLLACTSSEDVEAAQTTLEFWFFFLDTGVHDGLQWKHIQATFTQQELLDILARLVHTLILQCKYPDTFIHTNQLHSDDMDVEAVTTLRREVADTILSLFGHWPQDGCGNGCTSCVSGLVDLLFSSSKVADVDAILYLLDACVELFDVALADSTSSSDDEDGTYHRQPPEGIQLLQHVLSESVRLPTHPLIVNGIARLATSVTALLPLPPVAYLNTAYSLGRGLTFYESFPVASFALFKLSPSILKYTSAVERHDLMQQLLACWTALPDDVPTSSLGDFVQTVLKLSMEYQMKEIWQLCDPILSHLSACVQQGSAQECGKALYLFGRALEGTEGASMVSSAFIDQLHPLLLHAIQTHEEDASFRNHTVQLLVHLLPKMGATRSHDRWQLLELCMRWYDEQGTVETLDCYIQSVPSLLNDHANDADVKESISNILHATVTSLRRRLGDVPLEQLDAGWQNMTAHCSVHLHLEQHTAELIKFFTFVKKVTLDCPGALRQSNGSNEPSHLWLCCRLGTFFLSKDHHMQELWESVCNFFRQVFACDELWISSTGPSMDVSQMTHSIVQSVLSYVMEQDGVYRSRAVWDFLYDVLHSNRISMPVRDSFHRALYNVVVHDGLLHGKLPEKEWQELPPTLLQLQRRVRFRAYLTSITKQLTVS